jgi:hypothetical protein
MSWDWGWRMQISKEFQSNFGLLFYVVSVGSMTVCNVNTGWKVWREKPVNSCSVILRLEVIWVLYTENVANNSVWDRRRLGSGSRPQRICHVKTGKGESRENKICYIRPNTEWTLGPQGFSTLNPILFMTLPAFNYEQDLISEASSLSCGDIKGRFHPTTLQNKKKFSMPTPLLKCFCALCRYPLEIFSFLFYKNTSLSWVTYWLQALWNAWECRILHYRPLTQ